MPLQVPLRFASAIAFIALLTTACGGEPKAAAAGAPGGQGAAPGGAAGGAPAGAAGAPRRTASVVLGAADVARVTRGSIEAGIPISGDLRAIETLSLKSRLEGNVEQVYVREGDRVKAGATLARFEAIDFESALRSAEADVTSATTAASTAQWNYDQSKDLFKVGAIAERDLRATEQAAASAKAQQAAAESRLRAAQSQVRDTRIVAPVNGTIEFRRVQGGEHISRGAELFTLVRTEILELSAALPARRANDVKPGQSVRFLADGKTFTGRVARVSPTIDQASRSITAYVQIPNSSGELKGNTFSSGQIIAQTLQNVLVVPQPAVRFGQDSKPFVYRITAGELEQVPVTVGITDEARNLVEIKDGLQIGDQVVIGNVGTLGRGMKAQIIGNERGTSPGGARGGETRDGVTPGKAAPGKTAPDTTARTKRDSKPGA
ncbi:MAG: efflux RND transporter periplasmic adaptor subunit [Gemmatimonadaceae bacterium]|nr:efflux RND transporter periplasmic adaptor subunit [Gemmatimonadaceae bacterium]